MKKSRARSKDPKKTETSDIMNPPVVNAQSVVTETKVPLTRGRKKKEIVDNENSNNKAVTIETETKPVKEKKNFELSVRDFIKGNYTDDEYRVMEEIINTASDIKIGLPMLCDMRLTECVKKKGFMEAMEKAFIAIRNNRL